MRSGSESDVARGSNNGIPFEKIEANGNDFVLCDNAPDRSLLPLLCDRHRGVGADGVMIFEGVEGNRVLLDHLDPDGTRTLCLNGIRASLACLCERGTIPNQGTVSIQGLEIVFEVMARPRLWLTGAPYRFLTWRRDQLNIAGFYVNVGNPHFVCLGEIPPTLFADIAPQIRADQDTFPNGVNVHLLEPTPKGWRIRSFERGVEAFTLACGSGILAAAIVLSGENLGHNLAFLPDGGGFIVVQRQGERYMMEGTASWVASGVWRCGA